MMAALAPSAPSALNTPNAQPRPRIRDHGRFWLAFVVLVVVGLLTVSFAFMTLGISTAGFILLAEGMIGLGLGIK